jgi:transcriptional pleiotropic regulator of transition state genes
MKSTGVVRKIDELGRIVLPSELRKVFGIHEGDQLDISVDGEQIILQKRQDTCLFCSNETPTIEYRDRQVCESCAGELGRMGRLEVRLPDTETVGAPS